ncbi:MAG: peptidylprolyl isomerase [Chthonomonadales bacterium]
MKRHGCKPLAAAIVALALVGCGHSQKVVAHVNNDVITEDEFNQRTRDVTAANLAPSLAPGGPRGPAKAGEFAMDSLIAEKLILQLAAERHCTPTDAQINAYIAFAKKYRDPRYTFMPYDPARSDADWYRDARYTVAFLNMVKQQAKITDADLKSIYDKYHTRLREPDMYHLRIIDIREKDKALKALASLKKLPFETVALTQSEDPVSGPRSGDVGFVAEQQIPGPVLQAVKKLKPGEYTPQIIPAKVNPWNVAPGPGAPVETRYFIAQLVDKKVGRIPTMEEVRPLLENAAIEQKDPGAVQRVQNALREYQQKARITINLKPYDALFEKTRRASAQQPAATPSAP